jgi:hypothetical protein
VASDLHIRRSFPDIGTGTVGRGVNFTTDSAEPIEVARFRMETQNFMGDIGERGDSRLASVEIRRLRGESMLIRKYRRHREGRGVCSSGSGATSGSGYKL